MFFNESEVFEFINNNDIKFIRLSFCDINGIQKNISIMPSLLNKAITSGIAIDASSIDGFSGENRSELFLYPDLNTLSLLPWRPSQGRVVRFYCDIKYPDGTPFELDGRGILKNVINELKEKGYSIRIGSECEFYLFKKEGEEDTLIPFDNAGYLDVAPKDRGENVRREICLTLEEMAITPESSHHEAGPGQNEIDFRYSDPLKAADDLITLKFVISTIADRNGLSASFAPKPLKNAPGNGLHINISVKSKNHDDVQINNKYFMAGIMKHIKEMTCFLNPLDESYERLGIMKAPKYITWSRENRSQLLRVPCEKGEYERIEITSPDSSINPYFSYALLLYAGLEGLEEKLDLCEPINLNFDNADLKELETIETLPNSLNEAKKLALESEFINKHLPKRLLDRFK